MTANPLPISALPETLQTRLGGQDLIVFDGVCVLCSGFFRFILRHDRRAAFRFATAQSPLGQALYQALDLPTAAFETNLVLINGKIYQRLDAFAAAMQHLGGVWRLFGGLRLLPAWVKDPLYHLIARNRYAIFGRTQTCLLPDAALCHRFLPDGFGP
jgi:predicted DCC family thiol-disulfide oxidoreductase YuxK